MPAAAPPLVTGSTYRFSLTAEKDGAAWNLTGATIVVSFLSPSGTSSSDLAATIDSAAGGTAHYDNAAELLTEAGQWSRSWKITQSGVVQESPPIPFHVVASP